MKRVHQKVMLLQARWDLLHNNGSDVEDSLRRRRRSLPPPKQLIAYLCFAILFMYGSLFLFKHFSGHQTTSTTQNESGGLENEQQRRKPFAVVLFLTSCSEDVIYCELGFTAIQSLVDSEVSRWADLLILTLENETSITSRFREDLFRLGVSEILEVKVPVQPPRKVRGFIENTDFAKLRVWELEQYHKVVLMDSDTFVINSIEDLFFYNDFASSPGGFSPLNCGFFTLKPSRSVYQEMLSIISDPSMFSFETGWNNTGVKGFKGGMKGKLPSAATCQGFLHYYFHLRQQQQQPPQQQQQQLGRHQQQPQHLLDRSLVARTLPSNYVCDCSCQMSDNSLSDYLIDPNKKKKQEKTAEEEDGTKGGGREGGVKLFHFSGPCKPFPLPKPIKVRTQQRLRFKYRLLREAHQAWEETHDRALARLGSSVYLVNKGLGTHPLVAHLDVPSDLQLIGGANEEEEEEEGQKEAQEVQE